MRTKIRSLLFFIMLASTAAQAQSSAAASDSMPPLPVSFFYAPVFDTLPSYRLPALINALEHLSVKNGYIFFSGTNYPNTVSFIVNGMLTGIKPLFEKCIAGSKITLEKFIIILPNGNKKEINKSIFLK